MTCEWMCLFWWMNVSVQNGCARSNRMDVLFKDNPFQPNKCVFLANGFVYSKWFCLFQLNKCVCSKWLCPFRSNGCAYSERLPPNSYKKSRIPLQNGWLKKTQNHNNHKNKWVQVNFIEFLNSSFWFEFFFYFRSLNKWKVRINFDLTIQGLQSASQNTWMIVVFWETNFHYPVSIIEGDIIVLKRFIVWIHHSTLICYLSVYANVQCCRNYWIPICSLSIWTSFLIARILLNKVFILEYLF